MRKFGLLALATCFAGLAGCTTDNGSPLSPEGLPSFARDPSTLHQFGARTANRLQIVNSDPGFHVQGERPAVVYLRGFDRDGQLVFGPDDEPYDADMEFAGIPDETTRVELEYHRAQGFALARHTQSVDFYKFDHIVVPNPSPQAVGNRNTFTVRIENNSDYPDDQVFVSVNGKDRNRSAFYYVKFGPDYQNTAERFGGKERFAEYSQALSQLRQEGPHTYSFQCPRDYLVSGRIYLSFGQKLQGLGLNNLADPLSLSLPSPSGAPDAQTLWEFMELSATSPPENPDDYTLFVNTSVVDFFSLGLGMTLSFQDNGNPVSQTVGFVENARNLVLAAFEEAGTPPEFRVYVRRDGSNSILRVLAPNQGVAIQPDGPLSRFLDPAINSGWNLYSTQVLNLPDTLLPPYYYRYTGLPIVGDILSLTCVAKPPGDTAGGDLESLNEVSNLPKPTSRIIFFCDDDGPLSAPLRNTWKNAGSEGHKRLCSLLSAALNRGVFENYADWNNAARFYTRPDGCYNHYAKIMHRFALNAKVYGFGYDDVYGQDPTLARPLADVNQVVIRIPPGPRL